ncbi:DUF4065 domain-containing protein [Mesorhizobium sp. YIM 152430]|nr:type II toxin-antitoxin system antitoxin SocA domain-containing protein [Mesorhizobium sp. YIM 152430]MDF1601312.1 DUF4065 domain-containing protein [Mesorhizobium sp. YIM 152430]
MAVSAHQAAKTLAVLKDWTVTNLELQKLLYIAHMVHLGEHGEPLISDNFEAWDYGPVVPGLYQHLKGFGADPIGNVFHSVPSISEGSREFVSLVDTVKNTRGFTPGRLVSITHWPEGAWAEYYRPGNKGIIIPNESIKSEYDRRAA